MKENHVEVKYDIKELKTIMGRNHTEIIQELKALNNRLDILHRDLFRKNFKYIRPKK